MTRPRVAMTPCFFRPTGQLGEGLSVVDFGKMLACSVLVHIELPANAWEKMEAFQKNDQVNQMSGDYLSKLNMRQGFVKHPWLAGRCVVLSRTQAVVVGGRPKGPAGVARPPSVTGLHLSGPPRALRF